MKVGELKIVNRELGEMIDERINTNNGVENEEQEINLYALFFKYMVYWPWFVASVLVCCIGM